MVAAKNFVPSVYFLRTFHDNLSHEIWIEIFLIVDVPETPQLDATEKTITDIRDSRTAKPVKPNSKVVLVVPLFSRPALETPFPIGELQMKKCF